MAGSRSAGRSTGSLDRLRRARAIGHTVPPSSLRGSCAASSSPASGRSRRSASMPHRPGIPRYRVAAASGGSRRSTPPSTRCGSPRRCAASTPASSCRPKEARRMDRNVLLAVSAAKEAWDDAGLDGVDPARVGILVGSAIGGIATIVEQQQVFAERGPDRVSPFFIPSVLVDTASGQIAIQLGLKGQNFAPVSACATGSTAIGEAAASIRRGQADVVLAGGTEAPDHAADPRRVLRDARARRRGGGPDARLAAVRRDACGLRHGGGCVHPRSGGARGRARPGRDDLRRGARLRRLERRAPPRAAGAGGNRGRGDDRLGARRCRRRPGAGRLRQRARDVHARSAISPRHVRSSRCSATTPTASRSRRRSP